MRVRSGNSLKALSPMEVTVSGMLKVFSPLVCWKAQSPIFFSVFGSFSEVSLARENAPSLMVVTANLIPSISTVSGTTMSPVYLP